MAVFARNGDRTGVTAKTTLPTPDPNGYLKRRGQPASRFLHAGSNEAKFRAPSDGSANRSRRLVICS
jgi:hypothetical protein